MLSIQQCLDEIAPSPRYPNYIKGRLEMKFTIQIGQGVWKGALLAAFLLLPFIISSCGLFRSEPDTPIFSTIVSDEPLTLGEVFLQDELLACVMPEEKVIYVNDAEIEEFSSMLNAVIEGDLWTVIEGGVEVQYKQKPLTKKTMDARFFVPTQTYIARPWLKGWRCVFVPKGECMNFYSRRIKIEGGKPKPFLKFEFSTKSPGAKFCQKEAGSCYADFQNHLQTYWDKKGCKGKEYTASHTLTECTL